MKKVLAIVFILLLLFSQTVFAGGGKNGNPDYYGDPNGDSAPLTNEHQAPNYYGN